MIKTADKIPQDRQNTHTHTQNLTTCYSLPYCEKPNSPFLIGGGPEMITRSHSSSVYNNKVQPNDIALCGLCPNYTLVFCRKTSHTHTHTHSAFKKALTTFLHPVTKGKYFPVQIGLTVGRTQHSLFDQVSRSIVAVHMNLLHIPRRLLCDSFSCKVLCERQPSVERNLTLSLPVCLILESRKSKATSKGRREMWSR